MKKHWIILWWVLAVACFLPLLGCEKTSDDIQREQQEKILMDGTSQMGMPAVKNFREKKLLKDIIELRDQAGLVTYSYFFSDYNGKFVFIGETIGYPIPYATQYTNPQKIAWTSGSHSHVIPQADPNGLFSPASAEGTWVLMFNPQTKRAEPQYIEHRVEVFTFKLPASVVMGQQ